MFDRVTDDRKIQEQLNTALQQLAYLYEQSCHDLIILALPARCYAS